MEVAQLIQVIDQTESYKRYGKILRVVGIMIESLGPAANIGEVCLIYTDTIDEEPIISEVVGFNEEKIILMPYTEVTEIGPGCLVEATGKPLTIKVRRSLVGHVIDALGNELNDDALPKGLKTYLTDNAPPNPMTRPPISEPIQVGIRAIDSLLTVGKGQRIGIFSCMGAGKRTLHGVISR